MRVLLDNDVVLDYLQNRPPAAAEIKTIFEALARKEFNGYAAAITINNVFYITKKSRNRNEAFKAVRKLLNLLEIAAANKSILLDALSLNFTDYEDAVQHACAEAANLDAMVTRNLADYKNATLPIYSPAEFLIFLKTR